MTMRPAGKSVVFFAGIGIASIAMVCLVVFLVQRQGEQIRPRRTAGNGRETVLRSGGDLQAALNAAKYGDTIILQAGGTYGGAFVLPYKGEGTGTDADYITIRTSAIDRIAADGDRIKPQVHSSAMPKILATTGDPAMRAEERAHHYKFIGVEFSLAPETRYVYNLIDIGTYPYTSLTQFPHHIIFDRCYVHPSGLSKARRGFALNGAETSVLNSHVSGFAGEGDETQAIGGWNGSGPFHIINNYLEAGAEVIMFGGGDPSVPGLVPSDIEIRRNYLYRPEEWAGKVSIKGSFELKNARRVIVDGNVIESTTPRVTAIALTVRNQGGKAPWSTLEDIQISNNISRRSSGAVNLLGKDNLFPSAEAKNIKIINNLFLDVQVPGESSYFMQISGGESVTVAHNTIQQLGNILSIYTQPVKNFVFRDNIVQYNLYGIVCYAPAQGCGFPSCSCFAGVTMRGNIIADNANQSASNQLDTNFPPGNFFVRSYDQIGFVDLAGGDWRLKSTSKIRGRATDKKDPGIDFAEFEASGVNSAVTGTR